MHILFLLYLLLCFWDFTIKKLQGFINIHRAQIKDICPVAPPGPRVPGGAAVPLRGCVGRRSPAAAAAGGAGCEWGGWCGLGGLVVVVACGVW